MSRNLAAKDLAYNEIAAEWQGFVDDYDTNRRLEVLVDEFVGDKVPGRTSLDAGCGLGFFTRKILGRGPAKHVAFDLAPNLVKSLSAALPDAEVVVADMLDLDATFGNRKFDVVVCSEVIEHTPDPLLALENLCRRVAPGGYLAVSCPNVRWKWLLYIAQKTGVRRKYLGYENWISASEMRTTIERCGLVVVKAEGIHLWPWQLCPKRMLRYLDNKLRGHTFGFSVNHAVLARHPASRADFAGTGQEWGHSGREREPSSSH
jgi:2-polyprenyl-3-methyl-5-hydroxy-6-metoxy-1,4-benzoquinol methylase